MTPTGARSLGGSAVPLIALAAGLLTGFGSLHGCAALAGLSALAGLAALLIGSCAGPWRGQPLGARVAAIALAGYAAALLFVEPVVEAFEFVYGGWVVLRAVAALIPFLIGAAILANRGWRTAAAGCWLLFYSGVASLAYNVWHADSGVWFIQAWID